MDKHSNRLSYDKKILSRFEIIGAYFVEIFYNNLYNSALRKFKASAPDDVRNSKSLTEEYKHLLGVFYNGIKEKEYYEKSIKGILEYYREYTKFSTISLHDFIDEIIRQFIPDEYFKVLGDSDKHFFLNKIIVNITQNFIDKLLTHEFIKIVIDKRDIKNALADNSRFLIDTIVDIQITEREQVINHFVKSTMGRSTTDTVDIDIYNKVVDERAKIWEKCEKTVQEKQELEKSFNKSKQVATAIHTKATLYRKALVEYKTKVDKLNKQIENLMVENASLKRQNSELLNSRMDSSPLRQAASSPMLINRPEILITPVIKTPEPLVIKTPDAPIVESIESDPEPEPAATPTSANLFDDDESMDEMFPDDVVKISKRSHNKKKD